MFVGREQELRFFEDKYSSAYGQLIVLYGRRRVGKTEMLRMFCNQKPHVFYSCREVSDVNQLKGFSERILSTGIPASLYIDSFQSWELAFREESFPLPPSHTKGVAPQGGGCSLEAIAQVENLCTLSDFWNPPVQFVKASCRLAKTSRCNTS